MSRILLVDSDPGERHVVRSRLADAGHEVSTAETGAKGLIEARASTFDLILLSAELDRGVDAAEVCRRMKSVPRLTCTPVVIYSSKAAGPDAGERMYDAGCEAFVPRSQLQMLERTVDVLLRFKARNDELTGQTRLLERENRRLEEERQRVADIGASASDAGAGGLVLRELAAGRPDGVLVVDGAGVVRYADIGACELLGSRSVGRSLGKLAPASGLEAFVRDARTSPREGFRFDLSRRDRAPRSLVASVVPVRSMASDDGPALRVVLLLDLGRRRVGEEVLHAQAPGIPREELGSLMEAARATYTPAAIVGTSAAARALATELRSLAGSGEHVLLVGERGSGRTLAARILHYSGGATGSFLHLRCSAMSRESLENELFGYVKGAFPAAIADRPGLLLAAQDGTLFLDEIAALPLPLQRRLAEVLAQGHVQRRGSARRERFDCRLIASTGRDPGERISSGALDADLYARVAGRKIAVPALRDRPGDVSELAGAFLRRFGRCGVQEISAVASRVLERYHWPGNVAELEVCVEEACRRAEHGRIELSDLPRPLRELGTELPERELIPSVPPAERLAARPERVAGPLAARGPSPAPAEQRPWEISEDDPISLELYEKKALLRALESCRGDKLAAARLLKVGKSTLYRKLKKFGIP